MASTEAAIASHGARRRTAAAAGAGAGADTCGMVAISLNTEAFNEAGAVTATDDASTEVASRSERTSCAHAGQVARCCSKRARSRSSTASTA